MKKLLLLLAAVATCASAYAVDAELEYNTQAWKQTAPAWANYRQGFGMDGAFYVRDMSQKIIARWDENGVDENFALELPEECTGHAVTRDEAGNIIARIDNGWSGGWKVGSDETGEPIMALRVFPGATNDFIDSPLPEEAFNDWGENGRLDYFGFAEGDVMSEGALYIINNGSTKIFKIAFVDGEVDPDNSGVISYSGANLGTANQSCVINPYTAADGSRHYLFVNRSAAPVDIVFDEENNEFVGKAISLPNKGACNGIYPFSLGGYDLFLYPTTPNYLDGFAIAEADAAEPILTVAPTVAANPNGGQVNWLCAEPVAGSNTKATIYQYCPGAYTAVYDFKLKTTITAVKDVNAAKQLTGVKYYNVAGVESATPFDGVNIVVNTYNDGSREATKVLR